MTSKLSSKGCKLGLSVIAFEQGVIFIVPHLLWHGASVFAVSSERPPHFAYTTRTKGYWQPFLTQDPNGKKKFFNNLIAFLEQQRLDYEKNAVDRYLEKKGRKGQGSRASSRISIVNERDDARSRAAVAEYIRRKKDRSGSSLSVHSNPNLRSPSSNDRPVSVISSRSLPTPVMSQKTIEEVRNGSIYQLLRSY